MLHPDPSEQTQKVILSSKSNIPLYSPLVFNYSKPTVVGNQELPVQVQSLAIYRGEFSAVIA